VRRWGRLVVDEAVGVARGLRPEEGEPRREFTPELRSGVFNAGSRWWASPSPRALCRFYAWLLDGTPTPGAGPLLAPSVLARYVTPPAHGVDRTVRFPIVLGRGFVLGWFWPHPYAWWRTSTCFGHAGNFSTLAWADPSTGCAIAAVTNGNRAPSALVTRFAGIGSGLRAACVD
jgi:CubicO group peptidase (beta-lactamase class C family)